MLRKVLIKICPNVVVVVVLRGNLALHGYLATNENGGQTGVSDPSIIRYYLLGPDSSFIRPLSPLLSPLLFSPVPAGICKSSWLLAPQTALLSATRQAVGCRQPSFCGGPGVVRSSPGGLSGRPIRHRAVALRCRELSCRLPAGCQVSIRHGPSTPGNPGMAHSSPSSLGCFLVVHWAAINQTAQREPPDCVVYSPTAAADSDRRALTPLAKE